MRPSTFAVSKVGVALRPTAARTARDSRRWRRSRAGACARPRAGCGSTRSLKVWRIEPARPRFAQPLGGRGAGRGLALADLVAIDHHHAGAASRPARGRRPARRSWRRRPGRRNSPSSGVRSAPRLVARTGIGERGYRPGVRAWREADQASRRIAESPICQTSRPCPRLTQRPSLRPKRLRRPRPPRRTGLRRPPDRAGRQARPQLRRDDQALQRGRRGLWRGGPDRQGRGPRRHRLQVGGRHPGERALDPPLGRSGRRGRARRAASTPSSSPRRTRRAGWSSPRSAPASRRPGARSRPPPSPASRSRAP